VGEARRRYHSGDGVVRTVIVDDAYPDRLVVQTSQDVEPILDGIKRDRETMRHGENKLAARIPKVLYEQLQHAGIADDQDLFKAWLNGPEAAPWRVWKGKL
jgi:hypothetical protein